MAIDNFQPTRDNLPEAVDIAITQAHQYRIGFSNNSIEFQYADLAISTLEHIKSEIQTGTPPLGQRTTKGFGYALIHEEPKFDGNLASLIMKIEDIYCRWFVGK